MPHHQCIQHTVTEQRAGHNHFIQHLVIDTEKGMAGLMKSLQVHQMEITRHCMTIEVVPGEEAHLEGMKHCFLVEMKIVSSACKCMCLCVWVWVPMYV